MFGLALASAVLLDAIVIRMLLLPAVLELLGRTTWSLPRWLERRLPRVAIEPEQRSKPKPSLEPVFEAGS
jgi:RND superfamily putative drug exporter